VLNTEVVMTNVLQARIFDKMFTVQSQSAEKCSIVTEEIFLKH